MKYGSVEPLEIDGVVFRSVRVEGGEEELDQMLAGEAQAKGWSLHRRSAGVVVLKKAPTEEQRAEQSAPAVPQAHQESDEEWAARIDAVDVPDGKLICGHCEFVNRKDQMHGFVKCGTAKSQRDLMTRHSWVSPVYPRECPDYVPRIRARGRGGA
ncbi:hypothetical protein [Ottowia sp.]|uniref:hypothetical protein n=1 Tax=Ottowia sp. TaxID=1898956 RepID=UPI0025D197E2|nr:hypothetical protein [Ottowia sp.]MBK6616697.1 hypothetical protein [Ottowia sp.]